MAVKPFAELRGIMTANGDGQEELAIILGKSAGYVWLRLNAKAPWDQDDMYAIMDHYGIPYERLHVVFPKDGKRQTILISMPQRKAYRYGG